jgi:CHRD domain
MLMIYSISKISVGIAAAILASLITTVVTYSLTESAFAQNVPKFIIKLTGSQEVAPVQTNAVGAAEISAFSVAEDSLSYTINVANITGVTAGHTHLGTKEENRPIVFTFFKYDSPRNNVSETGSITADMLEGPMKGKPLSDLALAGANGTLYINIHTEKNPNGEIRGQVEGSFVK